MALGTTLGELITMLQAEIGASTNVSQAQGQNPGLLQILNRCQDFLYNDFDWPHLKIYNDYPLNAQQRYYAFNTTPPFIDFKNVNGVWVNYSVAWTPIQAGITPVDYNYSNPDAGTYSDPVLKWDFYENGSGPMFEVWPVPAGTTTQKLRFRGKQQITKMVANSDRAILDDYLIVLMAAADLLTGLKKADAASKQQAFTRHYTMLRARETKKGQFVKGGGLKDRSWHDYNIRIKEPDTGL